MWSALAVLTVAGCNSGGTPVRDAGRETAPDVGATDDAVDVVEVAGGDADSGGATDAAAPFTYSLLVTETPPGPFIDMSNWAGVRRYTVAGPGAPLTAATGIDKTAVHDPVSVLFRAASSEVLVGNRHGDNAGDGTAGSVSRFVYDRAAGTFTPNGAITGNAVHIVGQMALHPTSGELFTSNFYLSGSGPAVSRFTFDAAGAATPNGTLGDGTTQGLLLSPDGKRAYLTSGGIRSNVIRQYDLATGNKLADFTVGDARSLFWMAWWDGEIYVGDLDGNKVFRLSVDAASDELTVHDSFAADGPVSIAFSPDGMEMFTSGHLTSSLIDRFVYDATGKTWTKIGMIDTTESLGGMITVPAM